MLMEWGNWQHRLAPPNQVWARHGPEGGLSSLLGTIPDEEAQHSYDLAVHDHFADCPRPQMVSAPMKASGEFGFRYTARGQRGVERGQSFREVTGADR